MVRVLHASDFHLDSAYGGLSVEQARQRRQESRDLVRSMVDYGNDHGAQLLLLAGDLLDSDAVYGQTGAELSAALSAFRGEVVIAPGNHDCYTAGSPYATTLWSENVHIFTAPTMERIAFPQYGCVVYGGAFTEGEVTERGLSGFSVRPEDGELVKIGLLHGEVGSKTAIIAPSVWKILPKAASITSPWATFIATMACKRRVRSAMPTAAAWKAAASMNWGRRVFCWAILARALLPCALSPLPAVITASTLWM